MADPRSPGGTRALRRWTMGRRLMRRPAAVVLVLSLGLVALPMATAASAAGATTDRVSVTSTGGEANAYSQLDGGSGLSAPMDAMWSSPRPPRTWLPHRRQVACSLRDRVANTTELISVSYTGAPANGSSYEATISPDGRYVAFTSTATDLIDPSTGFSDTNASPDVYLRDLDDPTSGAARIVSVSSSGAQGNDGSGPAIDQQRRSVHRVRILRDEPRYGDLGHEREQRCLPP